MIIEVEKEFNEIIYNCRSVFIFVDVLVIIIYKLRNELFRYRFIEVGLICLMFLFGVVIED